MKIKEMIYQDRRDFKAIFICEHCGVEKQIRGYDDANFHNNVIPSLKCDSCGKVAGEDYQAKETKYPEGFQV